VKQWVDVKQFWGDVRPLTGRESYIAQGTAAEVQFSIPINYAEGIEPEMRVVAGARVFDITAVLPVDGRRKQLELLCTESV
jgi:SPP1 family predicted phage head-tail adaptor